MNNRIEYLRGLPAQNNFPPIFLIIGDPINGWKGSTVQLILNLRILNINRFFWYWRLFLNPAKDLKINQIQKLKLIALFASYELKIIWYNKEKLCFTVTYISPMNICMQIQFILLKYLTIIQLPILPEIPLIRLVYKIHHKYPQS